MQYLLADETGRVVVMYNEAGSTYQNMSQDKRDALVPCAALPEITQADTPEGKQGYYKIVEGEVTIAYEDRPINPEEQKLDEIKYMIAELMFQEGPVIV